MQHAVSMRVHDDPSTRLRSPGGTLRRTDGAVTRASTQQAAQAGAVRRYIMYVPRYPHDACSRVVDAVRVPAGAGIANHR
jgi:hypothetical protein